MLPTGKKSVNYENLHGIDFTSSKTLKKQLDKKIDDGERSHDENVPAKTPEKKTRKPIPPERAARLRQLFEDIKEEKPACLSVRREYCHMYKPESLKKNFPMVLTELYDDKCADMSREDILEHCKDILPSIQFKDEEAANVEMATRDQSDSVMWYRFRAGRITASRMKAACSTSCEEPSPSLLKSICYPAETKFTTAATLWGCRHEESARTEYQGSVARHHQNFMLDAAGLHLNSAYPHVGASPDGIVDCDCCGKGTLEVKCSYCMRDEKVHAGKGSCLEETDEGLRLKKNHPYYYQVQTQIFVCSVDYCDFVMWTNQDLFVQRIEPDPELWINIEDQSAKLFSTVILPELVGKFYSKRKLVREASVVPAKPPLQEIARENHLTPGTSGVKGKKTQKKAHHSKAGMRKKTTASTLQPLDSDSSDENQALYCICAGAKQGRMIGCDSSDCPNKPFEWFHFKCMKLKNPPKGDWFCPDCRERQFLTSVKAKRGETV